MYIFLTEKYDLQCNVKKQKVDSNTRWQEVFGSEFNCIACGSPLAIRLPVYLAKLHWFELVSYLLKSTQKSPSCTA